jgi:hypothetical protein
MDKCPGSGKPPAKARRRKQSGKERHTFMGRRLRRGTLGLSDILARFIEFTLYMENINGKPSSGSNPNSTPMNQESEFRSQEDATGEGVKV